MPLLLLIYFYLLFLRRNYAQEDRADERHFVTTADGFSLALFRHRPHGAPKNVEPVLLVHGLGANRFNFDAADDCSLARYLAAQGYDVWLVDLRGSGESAAGSWRWQWTFDDHVDHDVPPVLEFICRETGRERVHWIGHSMGGMLLYAHLLRQGGRRIASGVTLGSPVRFTPRPGGLHRLAPLEPLVKLLPMVPAAAVGRLAAPLVGLVGPALLGHQMNVANVDWGVIRKAYYNVASHLAPGVLAQFLAWMRSGDFAASDGFSYRDNLARITTPLFVVAGKGDRISPAADVRPAYDAVASARKAYLELAQCAGFACDYGHLDLIFGRQAPTEVYPRIAAWLADYRTSVLSAER